MGKFEFKHKRQCDIVMYHIVKPEVPVERMLTLVNEKHREIFVPLVYKPGKKGKGTFFSDITDFRSLEALLTDISEKEFFDVLLHILRIYNFCRDNRINVLNLELTTQGVFVEKDTKAVRILYWPIINNACQHDLLSFILQLMDRVEFKRVSVLKYYDPCRLYLKNVDRGFSPRLFEKFLDDLMNPAPEEMLADREHRGITNDISFYEPMHSKSVEAAPSEGQQGTGCLVLQDGSRVMVDKLPFVIGKKKELCQLSIPNRMISRVHAEIYVEAGKYFIKDRGSTNGTKVNGELIGANCMRQLSDGDKITLADEVISFVI